MATTRRFERMAAILTTVAATFAAAGPAIGGGNWMPLLPDQDFYDFQLFAPPDLNEYAIYPGSSDGFFFNYDRLYWGITVPDVVGVGQTQNGSYIIPIQPISPQTIVQLNNANISSGDIIGGLYTFGADVMSLDLNTSWMRTKMTWGNRYEGGWIYEDRGMIFTYFDTGDQGQTFTTLNEFAASSPQQIFTQSTATGNAQQGGTALPATTTTITSISPPPDHIIAQKLTQENQTRVQSAGFAAIIRRQLGGRGSRSSARIGLGPRFLQFEDRYSLGYESNQYPFDVGTAAAGGSVTINGQTQTGQTGSGNALLTTNVSSAGDVLGIEGVDALTGRGAPTPLQTGAWETYTTNNMVGPEISLLLESHINRWTFSTELKFVAGMNWQNNLYRGSNFPEALGADFLRTTFTPSTTLTTINQTDPITLTPPPLFLQIYGTGQANATNDAQHRFIFSPIGEWRFGAQYRVSQAIMLRAGYTGLWMAGIARASSNTGYGTVTRNVQVAVPPPAGSPADAPWTIETRPVNYNRIVAQERANEYVFTNGIDFGIEIKY